MKRLQLLFTALAILVAGAGVFATARVALDTQYWRAPDANPNTPGNLCGVMIDPQPCDATSGEQCVEEFETQIEDEVEPSLKPYYISKKVDEGPCVVARKAD